MAYDFKEDSDGELEYREEKKRAGRPKIRTRVEKKVLKSLRKN